VTTKSDKQWMDDITSLGCVVCRNEGHGPTPAEVHHIRATAGMGQRADNTDSIPLCPPHHRLGGYGVAFHAGPAVWQEQFGTELELLSQTRRDVEHMRARLSLLQEEDF